MIQLLSNLNLAFIGDSLTRYQYLSLVYYAHTGLWLSSDRPKIIDTNYGHLTSPQPHLLNAQTFPSWNHFFHHSTWIFDDRLVCDCFRTNRWHHDVDGACENRYYADPARNIYLTFLQTWGDHDTIFRGYRDPTLAVPRNYPPNHQAMNMSPFSLDRISGQNQWVYDWTGIIRNHLAKLHPKPDYLIINAGLRNNKFQNISLLQEIRQALDDVNIKGIFQTTPRLRPPMSSSTTKSQSTTLVGNSHPTGTLSNVKERDQVACHLFHYCFNITNITAILNHSDYYDTFHFYPHVYTLWNTNFLNFLDGLPT